MPLLKEEKPTQTNQTETYGSQTKGSESYGFDTQSPSKQQNNQSQPNSNQKSGLMTIIGQLLPLAPFAFEQFTGQKVPHMTGTIAEMQMALINIQTITNCVI